MIFTGQRKSRTVPLTVAFIFLALTETAPFPRGESEPRVKADYEVPAMEIGSGREDRRSFGESKYRPVQGGKKKEDRLRDRDDLTEARIGDKLNRLRRETGADVDNGEVWTSKSKLYKKYLVGSGTEKKGRWKIRMAEHPEADPKMDSFKARARRQAQKPEKVDKYVKEMGFYVLKTKNDCASRPDKGNCDGKRVERDAALPARTNLSSPEYYAQRKKVMERFYSRQRQIAEKYERLNSTFPTSVTIRNLTDFGPSTRSPASPGARPRKFQTTAAPSTTTKSSSPARRDNGVRFDLRPGSATYARRMDEGKFWNPNSPTDGYPFNVDVRINPAFSTSSPTENAFHIQYNSTDKNCTLEGSVSQKLRKKKYQRPGCVDSRRGDMDDPPDVSPGEGGTTWGTCSGRLVYQHNLLLGLRGSSKLDAIFEVGIEGPICITCVTAQRLNDTKAVVELESGGRGENFAKLKLIGFENEGFSYILKIFAVGRTGNDCRNI